MIDQLFATLQTSTEDSQSVKFYTLNVCFYQLQHRIHPVFESTLKENIWSNTKQYNYSYILVLILPQFYIDLLSCKLLFL